MSGFSFSTVALLVILSCNNVDSARQDALDTDTVNSTVGEADSIQQKAVFEKTVTYDKYSFSVVSDERNGVKQFVLVPKGLEIINDTMRGEYKGELLDVKINDIDGDNFPEIGIIDITEPDKKGTMQVFTVFAGKSMGMVYFPEMAAGDKALVGYRGFDEFEFVENTLVRRFPLYSGENKTGKFRQMQYKLKAGEAMKQLVLVKVVDF